MTETNDQTAFSDIPGAADVPAAADGQQDRRGGRGEGKGDRRGGGGRGRKDRGAGDCGSQGSGDPHGDSFFGRPSGNSGSE